MTVCLFLACLSVVQGPTERSLATRFDGVVRSLMPEWVFQPIDHFGFTPNEEDFRWRKPHSELGLGLSVKVEL